VVFQHDLPFDRSSLTRWRHRQGAEQIAALLQEGLSVAQRSGAIEIKDLARVVVDHCPGEGDRASDRRPAHASHDLVDQAKRDDVQLRQGYLRLAKRAAIMRTPASSNVCPAGAGEDSARACVVFR